MNEFNIKNGFISNDNSIVVGSLTATTFYGNGQYLTGINDFYVTGGTFDSGTNTLTLGRQNGSVTITGFTSGGSGSTSSGNYLPISGGTIYGNLTVTGNTILNSTTATTLYTNYIDFNTSTATTTTTQFGRINWDSGTGTLNIGIGDSTTGLIDFQVGQEEVVRVYNAEATSLTAGTIVYVSGSQGNRPSVKRALATTDGYSVTTLGMVDTTITSGSEGYVTTFGMINNLNTDGLSGGTPIWLSPTLPGVYTTVKPKAPDHTVLIGYVVRVHPSVGSIFVNISNGWEIDELHDVRLNGRSQGDLLVYSGYNGSNVWTNSKTLNGTYTVNGNLTVTGNTNSGTFYGSGLGLTNIPISGVTNLQTELDKKFDKSGGTINGNLTVTGNTTINGILSATTINTSITNNQIVYSNNGTLTGSTNLIWTNSASILSVSGTVYSTILSGNTLYATNYPDLPYVDGQTIEMYSDSTGTTYVRLKETVSSPTGGTRTFLGNIDITSGLTVTGGTTLKDGLTANTINTPITNNQIIYSNNGTLTGSTNLNWDNSTTTLSITGNTNNIGSISASTFYGSGLGLNNIPISGVANLQTELDKKYDKSGGTISGNVTINGNLTVTGNTSLSAFTGSSGTITGVLTVNGQINLPQPYSSTTLNYKASPYYKTVITNTNLDQVFYVDNYIELFWDDATTDDIELTILTNPTVSKVHVIRNNVTNNSVGIFDLNIASGRTAIDPEMDNDDRSEITIWAPSDSTWPFYRILIVKSNSTNYTNTPAYVLIEKFT